MASATSRRRLVRLHLGLAAATVICTTAFVVEVLRAAGGNELSWAYVFEWPLLLGYGVYMWRRLVADERLEDAGVVPDTAPPRRRSAAARERSERRASDEAAALDEWNRYLADLHAAEHDPPKPS